MNIPAKITIISAAVALLAFWQIRYFSRTTPDAVKGFWVLAFIAGVLIGFPSFVLYIILL